MYSACFGKLLAYMMQHSERTSTGTQLLRRHALVDGKEGDQGTDRCRGREQRCQRGGEQKAAPDS
jgi:hypothetical protein